jgi:hypothetical protein
LEIRVLVAISQQALASCGDERETSAGDQQQGAVSWLDTARLASLHRYIKIGEVILMPRIDEIVGEGPQLAQSQKEVLELLEKHPDYLFRMHNDDLAGLKA